MNAITATNKALVTMKWFILMEIGFAKIVQSIVIGVITRYPHLTVNIAKLVTRLFVMIVELLLGSVKQGLIKQEIEYFQLVTNAYNQYIILLIKI